MNPEISNQQLKFQNLNQYKMFTIIYNSGQGGQ